MAKDSHISSKTGETWHVRLWKNHKYVVDLHVVDLRGQFANVLWKWSEGLLLIGEQANSGELANFHGERGIGEKVRHGS